MVNCKFTTKYFDYDEKKPKVFQCEETPLSTGFCIFHDIKYSKDDDRIARLNEKLDNLPKNKPFFCIGYIIPKLQFRKKISNSVYFTKGRIEDSDFSNSNFNICFQHSKCTKP